MLATLTPVSQQQANDCAFSATQFAWTGGSWVRSYFCVEPTEGHVVTSEQYRRLLELDAPFSVEHGAALFSYGVGIVLASYVVAYLTGVVLRTFRNA